MSTDPAPLLTGQMRLTQHRLPALESGDYRLSFSQQVTISGVNPATGLFGDTLRFAVAGERFTLAPADIDSVFPPPNAQGEFYNVLPHITFVNRTLPWERAPTAGAVQVRNSSADVPSWLALLVLDHAEAPPIPKPATVAELVNPPAGITSYPGLATEFGEQPGDACNVVDICGALFVRIAPSLADLAWLAHVRSVLVEAKPSANPQTTATQDYAVLVANRLARMGSKSTVLLVSLEGMADYLPGSGTDGAPALTATTLRLACLASWSFDCPAIDQSFAGVLEALGSVGVLALPAVPVPDTAPDPESLKQVAAAMAMGYVGMNHQLRDGGQTASWYRGPLIPYHATARLELDIPLGSADAALRYDPDNGLLDASYAAAWQLGRMLALQSKTFSSTLLRWKHAIKLQRVADIERSFLLQAIKPDAPPGLAPGPALESIAAAMLKQVLPALHASADSAGVTRRVRPRRRALNMVAALADPAGLRVALENGPAMPASLTDWLERLQRLHGVPYAYLLPSAALLPAEAMRFFYLDRNWIDALVDGALSLGDTVAGDLVLRQAMRSTVAPLAAAAAQPITGFLLRSRAVKQWPGMEATTRAGGNLLALLRYERLGPETLLCLADGALDSVDLHEPPEGLHFGFDVPDKTGAPVDPTGFFKHLRDPANAGPTQAKDVPMAPFYRTGPNAGGAVVNINALASQLARSLSCTFTAAEFALEMIEGVDLVSFTVNPGTAPSAQGNQ